MTRYEVELLRKIMRAEIAMYFLKKGSVDISDRQNELKWQIEELTTYLVKEE
jgi:hypothetical protein